jgi:hypothetical protein
MFREGSSMKQTEFQEGRSMIGLVVASQRIGAKAHLRASLTRYDTAR